MTDSNHRSVPGPIPVYNFNDIPGRSPRPHQTQKVFRGNQVAIGWNVGEPGMVPRPHSHNYEQIFVMLSGRTKLHVGEQVFDMTPGSVIRIPPNVEHWAEAPEDGRAEQLDIFAPIRPDYYELTQYQSDKFDE